jgi:hypothetical protein
VSTSAVAAKNPTTNEGKGGRHLKVTSLEELPRDEARRWLRVAARLATAC